MSDWRLDAIGQHDDSPPLPPAGEGDSEPAERGASARKRRRLRHGAAGAVVVVALAGFGGALWYAYDTYRTQGGAGIAPLIRADLEPTRIKPDQPGGMDVPHRDRLVLQDPAGDPESAEETTLVASAEEPLPPPDDTTMMIVDTANAAPAAAIDPGEPDPIGAIIAGDGKPDAAAARAGAAPKADAAAGAVVSADGTASDVSADGAAQDGTAQAGTAADAEAPVVPAVPAGAVQVAQLDQPRTASDAAPAAPRASAGTSAANTPLEADAAGTDAMGDAIAGTASTPDGATPEGTEALLPRLIEVAQATEDPPAAEEGAEEAAEEAAEAATDDSSEDPSEGLPEISPTPQLAPATPQAEAAAQEGTAETGDASTDATPPEAVATPVLFAVPLGALDAAAAADLRVAEAIAPAGFDAGAALTAFGTRPSGLEQSQPATGDAVREASAADTQQDEATTAAGQPEVARDEAQTQTAAAPPPAPPPAPGADAPRAATPGAGADAGWRVQLAAVTSEGEAEEEWSRFQARFPSLLGDLQLIVPTVMIDGRRWYRVQAGPLDESVARQLCVQLKEQGADCIVRQ